ncbi:hypothetical protein BJX68DRAFT_245005 [Aspergillus pseudodeflectus]|uniref:APS kinase domain-containing protein n=1 Tax=Aspergillus pseudodeflectus TaxID=176178 RepID=A0ABR4JQ38_9EURO
MTVQVILISGRSGVGKTTIANEMHAQLNSRGIPHAHIDIDNLDMVYPEESGSELLLRNLTALVSNYYRLRGCQKFILSGTAVVLEHEAIQRVIKDAVQKEALEDQDRGSDVGPVEMRAFILTAGDEVVLDRLLGREVGSTLDAHLASSRRMAGVLERDVGDWGCRVPTRDRNVTDIALQILEEASWI